MQSVIDSIERQYQCAQGECRRLFHGRGGCFEGFEWLVVDLLPPVALIRVFAESVPQSLEPLIERLMAFPTIDGVALQIRGRGPQQGAQILAGQVPEQCVVVENGLRYEVRPLAAQNSGLFMDMRPGREWVRSQSREAKVLNLFAYTCGFSVAALAGGASSVVNLDMSSAALATGRRNHRLNGQDESCVRYLALDLLRSWSRVRKPGPYDLVVVDPPSFQKGSFVAERDYRKVLRRMNELTRSGSRVLFCHNDPAHSSAFLQALVAAEAPEFVFNERLPLAEDFPERDEDAGLKALVYTRG